MSHKLDVYRLSIRLVKLVRQILGAVQRFDGNLASQLRRAATSVPLNLAEGLRRRGRDRAHLLTVAQGSAAEVQAILDVCIAMEALEAQQAVELEQTIDRVCAMLHRLRGRAAA